MYSNTEDDDFFNPTSSSNLASLFGTTMNTKPDNEASLTYTAPKQPNLKVGEEQESPKVKPAQTSVICSKFVEVFKLMGKTHSPCGKYGIAIIGNQALKTFDMILYKTKQDIISRSKLGLGFTFLIQNNNFGYFCDNQKQQWSVHFASEKDINEFSEKIRSCNGKITVHNASKPQTGETNETKPNVMESKPKHSETVPKSNISNDTSEHKDLDSDSTSESSTSQTKANILSRMAKMGQFILPQTAKSNSDSEAEELVNKPVAKKRQKFPSDHDKVKINHTPEYVMVNGQVLPVLSPQFPSPMPNQLVISQPQPSHLSDSLHVFIAENRTHNCELRMNMTQLSSKLDTVLSKLGGSSINESALEKENELVDCKRLIANLQAQQRSLEKSLGDNQEVINNLKRENEKQCDVILKYKDEIEELKQQKISLDAQREQHQTCQENLQEAQQTISNLQQTIQELSLQHSESNDLNRTIEDLKTQLEDKNSKVEPFSRKLKLLMNNLYQQVMANFDDNSASYQTQDIQQLLSKHLKASTLQIIEEFQHNFKTSDN